MKILRVQTSPRGENSESRKLGDHLIATAKRIDPTSTTILRDVSTGVALPDLTRVRCVLQHYGTSMGRVHAPGKGEM